MDSNATESWVYTLGETELRRLANALNINEAGVVPILRDCVVRYIKKRVSDTDIPWEEDDTLDASQLLHQMGSKNLIPRLPTPMIIIREVPTLVLN